MIKVSFPSSKSGDKLKDDCYRVIIVVYETSIKKIKELRTLALAPSIDLTTVFDDLMTF